VSDWVSTELVYENKLASADEIAGFSMEGEGAVSFPLGRMRLEGTRPPEKGQGANIVHWCPESFPDRVAISWNFWPIQEPGLAILFFAAKGKNGTSVLDPTLDKRCGPYNQYHHGDIDALHVSYFRRRNPDEIRFHTCNLRKSYGFHLVAQGADPLPCVTQAKAPYRIQVMKAGATVEFSIDGLTVFKWQDDGKSYGPILADGHIGFRQMTPLIAEYSDLQVHRVEAAK